VSQRRPLLLPLFAICNIGIGFVGLLLISVDLVVAPDPNELVDRVAAESPFHQFWNPISLLVDYATQAALLVGGVGLLTWMGWARRLTLWAAVVMFAKFISELP